MNFVSGLTVIIAIGMLPGNSARSVITSEGAAAIRRRNADRAIPGEPFNPSEFGVARRTRFDKNTQGSLPYLNEQIFQKRLARARSIKNGLVNEDRLWPKFGQFVFIPYLISSDFERHERHTILKAFENFHDHTCIRFVPRASQVDYIYIVYGSGCDSEAGHVGGEQTISLGENCNYTHVAIHEINHAVGFWHEHNRPDRDKYIRVYLDNVLPEHQFNFDKLSSNVVQTFGQKYDTSSIMHYDEFAFSKEPGELVVIEPETPDDQMGYATELSKKDIIKINKMYKCVQGLVYPPKPILGNPFTELQYSERCEDLDSRCETFLRNATSCENSVWMKANCRKSCKLCDVPCQDLHQSCGAWALQGACRTQPDYMNTYCQKSCLHCK